MDAFITRLPKSSSKSAPEKSVKKRNLDDQSNQSNKKQMYIDLGQKSFGKQINCKLCGMIYIKGDIEDENNHKKICSKLIKDNLPFSHNKKYITIDTISDNEKICKITFNKDEMDGNITIVLDAIKDDLGGNLEFVNIFIFNLLIFKHT